MSLDTNRRLLARHATANGFDARTALALEDAFTLYLLSGYGLDAAGARAHICDYLNGVLGLDTPGLALPAVNRTGDLGRLDS